MNKAEKSRPLVAQETVRAETAAFCGAVISCNHSITSCGGGQTGIAALLMHGADHSLPLRHLKEMTGLPGRDLRRQIEAARLAGAPILSDEHGYFLAGNQDEVARFVNSMRRRAKRIQAVAAAVEKAGV